MEILYYYISKKKEKRFPIKNIFKVHFLVYFFSLFSILMGRFQEYIIISSLILIHEMGHFFTATIMGIETDKIYLYPLGGISKFFLPINCNPFVEFFILIMGPVFQCFAFFLLSSVFPSSVVFSYHIGILLFNLLPIYPLDGGKIIHLFFHLFLNYRCSFKLSIFISYFFTVLLLFLNKSFSINMVILYLLLIYLIHNEENKYHFYYQKFLLERMNQKYVFPFTKIIHHSNDFYRYFHNILFLNSFFINEEDYLKKKYRKFNKNY